MTKVTEHVSSRAIAPTTVDVDIEVDSPDGELALEWKREIESAVKDVNQQMEERHHD